MQSEQQVEAEELWDQRHLGYTPAGLEHTYQQAPITHALAGLDPAPTNLPAEQSANQPIGQSANLPICQPISQSANQPISRPICQPIQMVPELRLCAFAALPGGSPSYDGVRFAICTPRDRSKEDCLRTFGRASSRKGSRGFGLTQVRNL